MKISLVIGWLCFFNLALFCQVDKDFQPWVLEASAGATLLSGGGLQSNLYPFGYAQTGPTLNVKGYKKVFSEFGISLGLGATLLPYDASAAGLYLLSVDPLAQTVRIQADAYQLYQFSAGMFYELKLSSSWFVCTQATVGVAFLRSPELQIDIQTQPHTSLVYGKGASSRLQYSAATALYRRLNYRIALGVGIQLATSNPSVRWQEEGKATIQDLSFTQWLPSLGIRYILGAYTPNKSDDI